MSERLRLDEALVKRGLSQTRARARDAILRGSVTLNGVVAAKPSQKTDDGDSICLDDPAARYVARSAVKLIAALDAFAIDTAGVFVLDVGASTGGFTQVLLERGAAHVHAIDVGSGQLHESIASNPRVTSIEGFHARDLAPSLIGGKKGLIVVDLSFISVLKVLGPILSCLGERGTLVILAKPQFEVGREAIGKGGIVRDTQAVTTALAAIEQALLDAGLALIGRIASPLPGGDGNQEYLLGAKAG